MHLHDLLDLAEIEPVTPRPCLNPEHTVVLNHPSTGDRMQLLAIVAENHVGIIFFEEEEGLARSVDHDSERGFIVRPHPTRLHGGCLGRKRDVDGGVTLARIVRN